MGFGEFMNGFKDGFNMVWDPILHNPITDFGNSILKRFLNFGDATINLIQYLPLLILVGGGLFVFVQVKNSFQ